MPLTLYYIAKNNYTRASLERLKTLENGLGIEGNKKERKHEKTTKVNDIEEMFIKL